MKRIISTVLVCVLLLGCAFTLASCGKPNKDYKKAAEALKDEGYTVEVKENFGGCAATVYAFKQDIKEKTFDEIYIYYYNSESEAEAAWDVMSEGFEKDADAKKGSEYNPKYGIKGSMIYFGTKPAVKAAKK